MYVGTLRYNRDTHNVTTKVTHINDYTNASAVFQKNVNNPVIKQKGAW